MYWSVIGDHSHIEESAMDGSLRRVLLEKNLRRPTGMYFFLSLHFFPVVTLFKVEEDNIGIQCFSLPGPNRSCKCFSVMIKIENLQNLVECFFCCL